ncbi:MAG: argininosuccinate synthase [Betaproteobacteria bacterium AqS2]|uniref:Argininosuccinate synthase n=1 Tax=Candidatus Amphirhobacter heronislandensis TaxID=1732024 RepID=A0A930UE64_9GAMM|nr:argininosuccinate synthase [Betaproteobacteria bacterium AqS2]
MTAKPSKIVLAYSGGLDTSVILRWLQDRYDCAVVAYIADLGQGEDLELIAARAKEYGAAEVVVEDLQDEFVNDFVLPMFRANAVYEGEYLLGTSIARPLIAKQQVAAARQHGADALAHGATGKGNDQIRFELGYLALAPNLAVIAPWRIWDLQSRQSLLAYAKERGIAIPDATDKPPYSMDANLLHISYEGGELEDPANEPKPEMWQRTAAPQEAPDKPEKVKIEFEKGDPVAVNGEKLAGAAMLARLNELAGRHGVGRADIVESRFTGMKSRGCYETPGGTLLLKARRALEALTLDREVMRLKDDLMPRYATMVYNGLWFSPERLLLQKLIDEAARHVAGSVTCELYRGGVTVAARASANSLHDESIASFEEDGGYDQRDAEGFIKLNALRLQTWARRDERDGDG